MRITLVNSRFFEVLLQFGKERWGCAVDKHNNLFLDLSSQWADENKVAIETSAGRKYRFKDIRNITARFANALTSRGVKPGDRVAVQVEKSPEALFLYLACLRAGAVYLPLNAAYTTAEVEYFLRDAEPTVFVCRPNPAGECSCTKIREKAGVPNGFSLGVDTEGTLTALAAEQPEEFEDIQRGADDLAAILYTSGTTGRSKGAMLTHGNLASNARALVDAWRFTPSDVLLHALPIFHTHGLFVATNVVLLSGASMIFLPKYDSDEIFRALTRSTVMMGVPTFYTRLLDDARLTRDAARTMRLFISGSAPLLPDTFHNFEGRTGHAILERYGMTETGMNTSNPYDGDRIPGTVGLPLPGVETRIANPETGEILGPEEIGMIELRGPNVFHGYWRMPDKTKAEFRDDGFFITGDLGKIDERGYVHIVGRGKDLVISGGFNVYPKEVESEIDAIPSVVESAVIGAPHPDFGEGVVALVVQAKGAALNERQVIDTLKARLANYKLPKRVLFVDELPRNSMGKVQKNLLRNTYGGLFSKAE
jgi:malonyl-CoA/methylmalonyl-CoA synthetase